MKRKVPRIAAAILFFTLWIAAAGCSSEPAKDASRQEAAQPTETSETVAPSETTETTAATEPSETTAPAEPEEALVPIPPTVDSDIVFENPFDILNNSNVKKVTPNSYADVYKFLDGKGFSDIDIFREVDPDSVHLGVAADDKNVVVGQFSFKRDDLVWNVRMEKADALENRTGIDMPTERTPKIGLAPFQLSINDNSKVPYQEIDCHWFLSGNFNRQPEIGEEFPAVEMCIAYFPKTGNLYSFYIQDTYVFDGKWLKSPGVSSPSCLLNSRFEEMYAKRQF